MAPTSAARTWRRPKLAGTDLKAANVTDANLTGVTYDANTRFPDGFDLDTYGLRLVPDAG